MSEDPTPATERVLFSQRSPLQEIVLSQRLDDDSINLTLDGVWQFDSHEEHIFHEVLVDVPMVMATDPRTVLILGGGDALALRNVLRYGSVERVVLVEIDPWMIAMSREVEAMRALSEHSLDDPRVEVRVEDALDFVRDTHDTFDVVICDFPACTHDALAPLFSRAFFRALDRLVREHGLVSIQVSQDPPGFWEVLAEVEAAFAWVVPLLVELTSEGSPDPGWADFIVASRALRQVQRSPAPGARFLTRERIPALVVRNRSGDELEVDGLS